MERGRQRRQRVSASYELAGADLGHYSWTTGILTPRGTVKDMLSRLQVNGAADVTNFEIKRNGHRVPLRVEYAAFVKGHNGDTTIESANAQFLQTHLNARGGDQRLRGYAREDRGARLCIERPKFRTCSFWLRGAERPALNGPLTLSAHVVLPPRPGRFLEKVLLKGAFRIDPWRGLTRRVCNTGLTNSVSVHSVTMTILRGSRRCVELSRCVRALRTLVTFGLRSREPSRAVGGLTT